MPFISARKWKEPEIDIKKEFNKNENVEEERKVAVVGTEDEKHEVKIELDVVGLKHLQCEELKLKESDQIMLRRDVYNSVDQYAIGVFYYHHNIGYIGWAQAKIICKYHDFFDKGELYGKITKILSEYKLSIELNLYVNSHQNVEISLIEARKKQDETYLSNKLSVSASSSVQDGNTKVSKMISQLDVEYSKECEGSFEKYELIEKDYIKPSVVANKRKCGVDENFGINNCSDNAFINLKWKPYAGNNDNDNDDNTTTKSSFPPSNAVMQKLGLPPASNSVEYEQYGLKPPCEWIVESAARINWITKDGSANDITSQIDIDTMLSGVDNCFTDETLADIETLVASENFFSQHGYTDRKKDQLIAVYGGGYVLGQKESDLKLVKGRDHNVITTKLCIAKNIIYTLLHQSPPQAPGFNTIIFGLTWRGAGFGYHADQKEGLPNKDISMVPNQPVVTTIIYQTEEDTGKETLFVIKKDDKITYQNPYKARNCLVTKSNGFVHVQSATLQSKSKHGVFHTLKKEERYGGRIAITSRISHVDAGKKIMKRLKCQVEDEPPIYKQIIDIEGTVTIKWKPYLQEE